MPDITRAIAALTCDHIETHAGQVITDKAPLLSRSISHELLRIDATLGGSPVLRAIAHSIDEALLALVEV